MHLEDLCNEKKRKEKAVKIIISYFQLYEAGVFSANTTMKTNHNRLNEGVNIRIQLAVKSDFKFPLRNI